MLVFVGASPAVALALAVADPVPVTDVVAVASAVFIPGLLTALAELLADAELPVEPPPVEELRLDLYMLWPWRERSGTVRRNSVDEAPRMQTRRTQRYRTDPRRCIAT
jgi:hypothetical protein